MDELKTNKNKTKNYQNYIMAQTTKRRSIDWKHAGYSFDSICKIESI